MGRVLCHLTLFGALALAGCFGSHGGGGSRGPDAGPPRADATPPPPPPTDGGTDSAPPPPPPVDCHGPASVRPTDLACVDGRNGVPVGAPFELPVTALGDCYCGELVGCTAERAADGSLALTTQVCPGPFLCDACFPEITGTCAMPPLEAGDHVVRVNGGEAFVLRAGGATAPDLSQCWGTAPPVTDSAFDCDFPGTWTEPFPTVCHRATLSPGRRASFRVIDGCAGCFDVAGGCDVTVNGREILLVPHKRSCDCPVCGDCPAVCGELAVTCVTPALEAGEYAVGVADVRFTVRVDDAATGDEVCVSAAP